MDISNLSTEEMMGIYCLIEGNSMEKEREESNRNSKEKSLSQKILDYMKKDIEERRKNPWWKRNRNKTNLFLYSN